MDHSKYFEKYLNGEYFFNESITNGEKLSFKINEFETDSFKNFYVVYGNKKYFRTNCILKILGVSREEFEKIINENKDLRMKIFIYGDRIKIRHLFGFRFDKIIEKIFDCEKRNIIIGEQYTKTKYKKFVLCRKYREIKINDFFKSLGLNFYDYVKNVFKENGLEAPNLLFITQNCAFKEEKEILDFLTLANKDLFEKIEAARIIEKLNREVNQ